MKMKKSLLAGLTVASTIGFFTPLTSHAFGLGKLDLMSALNEPFKAEIDVTALRPNEQENLQVKIASNDEFLKAGLDRSILLSQLQFDIVERQGETKILVTSKQAVKEPFLDFLLTASAGSGRLIREYTVLLDPPEYVMAETRNTATTALPASQTAADKTTTTSTRYQTTSSYNANSYAVKRSDTLWNIALETRPTKSVSVHQMMMALLRKNPSAFSNNNVNGLKAGVTLQIPTQDTITVLSKSDAAAEFSEQSKAWKNRNVPAPAVTTVTEVAEQTPPQSERLDKTEATAQEPTTDESQIADATTSDNEGRLQLVAPDEDVTNEDDAAPNVTGNDKLQKLTEQLTLAQETLEAQTQENIDFESRMDAMEEQLETMRRLISIKDADLARLQSNLEQENPELAAKVKSELQAENTDTLETVDLASQQSVNADASDTSPEATDVAIETANTSPVSEAQADTLINDASKALNLNEGEVKSVIVKVKQFVIEHKLETALGFLLVLLLLWLIARRNNREVTWDEAVQKLDKQQDKQSGPVVAPPVTDNHVTDAPLADEEKTVGELVEQADMFVGYADYVQARNALEQARLKDPEDTLVMYKMLFVLYKQQQVNDFVALAEEASFESDSYEWKEIKQWGHELAPNHALFVNNDADDKLFETDVETLAADELTQNSDTEVSLHDEAVMTDSTLETEEADTDSQENDDLDFDLSQFSTQSEKVDSTDEVESQHNDVELDDDLIDFETSFGSDDDAVENDEPLELDITNVETSDDDLSFDLDETEQDEDLNNALDNDDDAPDLEFDVGDLDDLDETETKLDLAAAYIDMGDPDGAKSILDEVLREGNDEQKERASSLLDTLS